MPDGGKEGAGAGGSGQGGSMDVDALIKKLEASLMPKIGEMITGATKRQLQKVIADIDEKIKAATKPAEKIGEGSGSGEGSGGEGKPAGGAGGSEGGEVNPKIAQLEKQLNAITKKLTLSEGARVKEAKSRVAAEMSTAIKLAASGMRKPEIYEKFIKDDVVLGEDGVFRIQTGKDDITGEPVFSDLPEHASAFQKTNPEFAPASGSGGGSGAGEGSPFQGKGLTAEKLASMSGEELSALANESFGGNRFSGKGGPFASDKLLHEEMSAELREEMRK